jgi:hypothetical protein
LRSKLRGVSKQREYYKVFLRVYRERLEQNI